MLFKLFGMKEGRYERKFFVSELSFKEIEQIVKFNSAIFSEIYYKRRVNNLYLDSVNMENYLNNVIGNPQRLKIRIRWYGKVFGLIKNPVLELKIKNSELGRKMSFPLKEFRLDKSFSMNYLQDIFSESDLPKWLIEKLKLFRQSLLNSYERKYFGSADKKYRITLDNNQIFFEIREKNNLFKNRIRDRENTILELKYGKEEDKGASEISQELPFKLTKSSKYVQGIDLLN